MEKPGKTFVSILLLVLAVEICLAQHWSYGLQPGGKRNAENAGGSFPEISNEMENQGEAQKTQCPGPDQRSRFSDLQEAMARLMAGEARRKKI